MIWFLWLGAFLNTSHFIHCTGRFFHGISTKGCPATCKTKRLDALKEKAGKRESDDSQGGDKLWRVVQNYSCEKVIVMRVRQSTILGERVLDERGKGIRVRGYK